MSTVVAAAALALAPTSASDALARAFDARDAPAAARHARSPDTRVDGAVLDRDGHGVDGATVIARAVGRPGAVGCRSFETLTDRRGRFHLDGLPPGSYWFIALHPRHPAGSSPALPVQGRLEVAIHLDDEPVPA